MEIIRDSEQKREAAELLQDIFEPGWREKRDEKMRAFWSALTAKAPLADPWATPLEKEIH